MSKIYGILDWLLLEHEMSQNAQEIWFVIVMMLLVAFAVHAIHIIYFEK